MHASGAAPNMTLVISDGGMPCHVSIFQQGSNISFVDSNQFLITEPKFLQEFEHEQFLVGFLCNFIDIPVPFEVVLDPDANNRCFCDKTERNIRNLKLSMVRGVSFEAHLEGLTLSRI